jgi:membrane protein required for colicin V production
MNYFDIVILIVLLFFLIRGLIKGFFIELASVLALILGIWGALRFSGYVGNKLTELFDLTTQWLGLISFAVTFVLIVIGVHFIAIIVDKLFSAIALGWLVKILGAVFGVIKALIIVSVVLVFLNTVDERVNFLPPDKVEDSVLYRPVAKIAPAIFPLIAKGDLINSFNRLKKQDEE